MIPFNISRFLVSLCNEGPKIPAPIRNKLNHKVQDVILIFISYAFRPLAKAIDL